ncbi:MAG: Rieske 2Fe-2S domain-containing protein [Pirellulaceae bacterium]|nr:Rieske 2Fe-2S domain-containing protein [Pirellulaceae bacterium]
MSEYIRVAQCSDCPPGHGIEVVASGRMIALFNVDGQFHALDGVCPHQGGPLGQGELCGTIVTCPWHGWQFDVSTGQHQITPTICQPRFDLKIEKDQVLVRVADLDES